MYKAATDTENARNETNDNTNGNTDWFIVRHLIFSQRFFFTLSFLPKFLKPIKNEAHSIKQPKANINPLPVNHPDIRAPKIAPGNVEILNISAALTYTFFCRKYANDPEMALHITENSDVPTIIDGDHSGNQYINNGTNTRPPPASNYRSKHSGKNKTTIKINKTKLYYQT